MATYTLDICKSSDSNTFLSLTYDKVGNASAQINISGISLTCKLLEIHFAKAVYQPGVVRFKLHLSGKSRPNITDIFKQFQNTYINLFGGEKKSQNIAIKYHLFDIQPEIKSESTSAIDLTIVAYSPDKYLALDKYCKAYTGKKLLHDIVSDKQNWPNQLPDEITKDYSKKQGTTETTDSETGKKIDTSLIIYAPQHLSSDETTSKEYIQPYLVQYNESFLDFLVRVMSRCGEFFFYENGKFHFGWKPSDSFTIDKYAAARFSQSIYSAWGNNKIGVVHDNYNYQDVNSGKNYKDRPRNNSSSSLNVNSEIASDENLTPIPPKNKYTSMEEFALMPGAFAVSTVSEMLNEQTLTDMITAFTTKKLTTITSSTHASTDANDQYEDDFFPENKKEGESQSAEYKERLDGKNVHLYSTTVSLEQEPFSQTFYTKIEQNMKQAEQGRAFIDLRENFYEKLSLGAEVTFEGTSYIVVRINGEITSGTESVQIEILPKVSDKFYPPLAPVSPIRTVSAQRAFVAANNDPMRMNRVRVRFPWQKDEDDPSPWIRIALPMASEDSGFNFIPENGDEAIVNFENGNIEKPYVEGLLYSADRKPSYTYKKNNMRSISSRNGHSIIFTDNKNGSDAFQSLLTLWSTVNSFVPVWKFDGSKSMQKATGGIELTDEYGLYSISMSSNKRAISIDSPLGSVSINAFTGITISAPNGNIRIEGKNIDIVAGNNLSFSSGNNINTEFWPFKWSKGSFEETISGAEVSSDLLKTTIGKVIDMKLIRTVIEAFLRPIGGTMLIKSYRYMRLEAGKGSAKIVDRNFIKQRWFTSDKVKAFFKGSFNHDSSDILKNFRPTMNVYQIVNSLYNFVKIICRTHVQNTKRINEEIQKYTTAYNALTVINNYANNIQGALKTTNNLVSDASNNTNYSIITVINPVAGQDEQPVQIDPALQPAVNNLNQCGSDLSSIIISTKEDKVWTDCINLLRVDDAKDIINDAFIKSKIEAIYGDFCWHKDHSIQVLDANQDIIIHKSKMREVLYHILKKAIEKQDSRYYNLSVESDFSNFDDDFKWGNLIDGIRFTEQQSNKKKDFLMSSLNISDMADQYVWDNTEVGEIFFSDKEGKTLHLSENGITDYERKYDADLNIVNLTSLFKNL